MGRGVSHRVAPFFRCRMNGVDDSGGLVLEDPAEQQGAAAQVAGLAHIQHTTILGQHAIHARRCTQSPRILGTIKFFYIFIFIIQLVLMLY